MKELIRIIKHDNGLTDVQFDVGSSEDFKSMAAGLFAIFQSLPDSLHLIKDVIELYENIDSEEVEKVLGIAKKKAPEKIVVDMTNNKFKS